MTSRTNDDLDARIRRAWPDAAPTTDAQAASALRAEIARRIAAEAGPTGAAAPAASPTRGGLHRRPRRLATGLAALVLLAGAIGVGGLLRQRLGERPQDLVRLTGDPTRDVRAAVAATRRTLDTATVTRTSRAWAARIETGVDVDGLRRFMRDNDAMRTQVQVLRPDGDWSDETTSSVGMRFAGARQVDGETFMRIDVDARPARWVHVTDAPASMSEEPPIAAPAVLDAVERATRADADTSVHDDGATVRYRFSGGPDLGGWIGSIDGSIAAGSALPAVAGNQYELVVIADARTGLLRSVRTASFLPLEQRQGVVTHAVVTFPGGEAAPSVDAPADATDMTYAQFCSQPSFTCGPAASAAPQSDGSGAGREPRR